MKISLKTILSTVTAVLVSMVWISAFGAGSSGRDTIDRVQQRTDRTLFVYAGDGAWNNPDGCDNASRAVLLPGQASVESYREKFAAILGAHLIGNTVAFTFNGCFNFKNVTVPIITNVTIF